MNSPDSNKKREQLYDYHKHNSVYISDYIKFADGKAGVALGANLIMIGFFGKIVKENGFDCLSFWEYSLLVGLLPLIISTYFLIWKVLWPRYTTSTDQYMSWGGIASFSNNKAYLTQLEKTPDDKFIEDMGIQNHSLSVVCLQKYKNLKFAFIFLTLGAVVEVVSWFLGS